jgi:hypothetical protein
VGEVEVLVGVRVLGAAIKGKAVHVDLYGGEDNVCGYVRFVFEDDDERKARVEVLHMWARLGTSVTFLSDGETVTLLDRPAEPGDERVSRRGSP